ncbi:Basic leucine zipper and W2 domain-containing protein 2 [Cladochytrium tenue]|nr:Basic leucine zipper and W2 domain-containing protein 2 [Cladochytrium tenue]
MTPQPPQQQQQPQQSAAAAAKAALPTGSDFKNRQRKRQVVTKHEPEVFRDSLLALIPPDCDIETYATVLESAAEKLDYKRYADAFFELFFIGGLVGGSLRFTTAVFQTYTQDQSMDSLCLSLQKAGLDERLPEFFPPNKRQEEYLARHFESEGLRPLVDNYRRKQALAVKAEARVQMIELLHGETGEQEAWPKLLESFCTSPKTEITLLQHLQALSYDDARFSKHFRTIVAQLYQMDVLSEAAVLYWYEKGALGNKGKAMFVKQMEPFVEWLRSQDDDDDEE